MIFNEKMVNNNEQFYKNRLYNKYKLLALNIFKWSNLPNGLKSSYIEQGLYEYGQVVFLMEKGKLICVPCSDCSDLNVYGESESVLTNGYNFVKRVYLIESEDDININLKGVRKGIRIKNNDLALPCSDIIWQYVNKIYEVEKAINLNVKQQKYPYLVYTDSKNELTMKNLFKKIEKGDEIAIYGSKSINLDNINILNLNTPYVVDKLNQYKYELERELLTELGLNNTIEKKERLLTDEINSNNDYIYRNVSMRYKERTEKLDLINKYFGSEITVEKVDSLHNEIDIEKDEIIE